jgi:hypothetical protein
MIYSFSEPIERGADFFLNWDEVTQIIDPATTKFWPRGSNQETLFLSGDRIIYSATTKEVFTGPNEDDWKQIITHLFHREKGKVYETEFALYLDAATAAYAQYMRDENAHGIKRYYPEDNEPRPSGRLTLWIGHYGGYYIDTEETLKGRGIQLVGNDDDGHGRNRNRYKVTEKALSKLKTQYSIVEALLFD